MFSPVITTKHSLLAPHLTRKPAVPESLKVQSHCQWGNDGLAIGYCESKVSRKIVPDGVRQTRKTLIKTIAIVERDQTQLRRKKRRDFSARMSSCRGVLRVLGGRLVKCDGVC